jgi:DNA-binding transcriptional MerR regulator
MDRKKEAAHSARKVGEALKVGAVAERLGVSASMVRSWEKLGLASPARSQSKYRLYTNDDLRVLRRAIYLRRVQGLNAPAILNQLKQEGLLNHRARGRRKSSRPSARGFASCACSAESRSRRWPTRWACPSVSSATWSGRRAALPSASCASWRSITASIFSISSIPSTAPGRWCGRGIARVWKAVPAFTWSCWHPGRLRWSRTCFALLPGAGSGESYSHEGEEFLYLVRGRLDIVGRRGIPASSGRQLLFHQQDPASLVQSRERARRSSSGSILRPLFDSERRLLRECGDQRALDQSALPNHGEGVVERQREPPQHQIDFRFVDDERRAERNGIAQSAQIRPW